MFAVCRGGVTLVPSRCGEVNGVCFATGTNVGKSSNEGAGVVARTADGISGEYCDWSISELRMLGYLLHLRIRSSGGGSRSLASKEVLHSHFHSF